MKISSVIILLVVYLSGSCCLGERVFAETHLNEAIINGQGAVCFSDGSKYVGQFKDGIIHGQGIIDFPDNSRYSGDFLDGEMNGQGIMIFPDGSKYVGQFKDGKIHGKGDLTFPDGSIYKGEFKDDKYHGEGTWSSPYGIGYEGQFKNGKFDGQGVYSLPDGSRYVGLFRDDHFHGHGEWVKGERSGDSSSTEQLTRKETGFDRSVEITDFANESFTEMEEADAETIFLHEESIQEKIVFDAHMDNHSQGDENMPAGDLPMEKDDPAIKLEPTNQEAAGISTLSMEDSEMLNSESNADQGLAAKASDSDPSSRMGFSVQVGAFHSRNNAERLTSFLIEKEYSASMISMLDYGNKRWFTVRIGTYPTRSDAKEKAISFSEKEQMMATVRPVDSL